MNDRTIEVLSDVISLLTNEKCKRVLKIVINVDEECAYMNYNDWEDFCESKEYSGYIKEIADTLNGII